MSAPEWKGPPVVNGGLATASDPFIQHGSTAVTDSYVGNGYANGHPTIVRTPAAANGNLDNAAPKAHIKPSTNDDFGKSGLRVVEVDGLTPSTVRTVEEIAEQVCKPPIALTIPTLKLTLSLRRRSRT